jgi:effector-binding domain-containing protein
MEARLPGNINIKHIPSRLVVFIKSRLKHEFHAVTARMVELANLAREHNLVLKGGGMTVFHDNYRVFDGKEGDIEVCFGVFADKSYDYSFIREIPSGLYASIIHEGDNFILFNETYPRLYEWIKQHQYEPVGPAINAYLDVPDGRAPKKVTIEIQVPVIKDT